MSTDEYVTTDFGPWIVVSVRRIAGGQRRGLVGRALGIRGAGARLARRGPAMNEDRIDKLYAGHMGIVAVLVNVLIDKGVITESELRQRFEQAHEAASRSSGGPGVAIVLEDMLTYLEPVRRDG